MVPIANVRGYNNGRNPFIAIAIASSNAEFWDNGARYGANCEVRSARGAARGWGWGGGPGPRRRSAPRRQ